MTTEPDLFHEDYQPVRPTERHQIALDLAAWCYAQGLQDTVSTGPSCVRDERGRYYAVALVLDEPTHGTVYVYGVDYLSLWYHTDRPGLPANDTRLFGSAEEVMIFLSLAFLEGKPEEALAIPQRQPRRRKKKAT